MPASIRSRQQAELADRWGVPAFFEVRRGSSRFVEAISHQMRLIADSAPESVCGSPISEKTSLFADLSAS